MLSSGGEDDDDDGGGRSADRQSREDYGGHPGSYLPAGNVMLDQAGRPATVGDAGSAAVKAVRSKVSAAHAPSTSDLVAVRTEGAIPTRLRPRRVHAAAAAAGSAPSASRRSSAGSAAAAAAAVNSPPPHGSPVVRHAAAFLSGTRGMVLLSLLLLLLGIRTSMQGAASALLLSGKGPASAGVTGMADAAALVARGVRAMASGSAAVTAMPEQGAAGGGGSWEPDAAVRVVVVVGGRYGGGRVVVVVVVGGRCECVCVGGCWDTSAWPISGRGGGVCSGVYSLCGLLCEE